MAPQDLSNVREQIEALDQELLELLQRRMALVEGVARAKLQTASPFRDPVREAQVVVRVRERAAALGLDPHAVESLYRTIMEMAIARQQAHVEHLAEAPLRIAYPGVEGSDVHHAARQRYAGRREGVLLLATESTRGGSVDETYELVARHGLYFTGEVIAPHDLALYGAGPREQLRTVYGDPAAIAHCSQFFDAHPHLAIVSVDSDVQAVERVHASKDPGAAAIATEAASKLYGLIKLEEVVDSDDEHATRFVEIARTPEPPAADHPCKTSLLIELSHRPGALGTVLGELALHGVNLTKIESRPVPGDRWRYRFFLDVEGDAAKTPLSVALEAVRPHTSDLRVLGTYAKGAA